jgi:phosphoribosylformylglycinamidine synthase
MKIKILVLTGYGINAEKELAYAFELAGGDPDVIHLEDIINNTKILEKYQILAFPGGFSFGDHIASGKVFANIVKSNFIDNLRNFINKNKLIIGICNGFQIITKLGIVPDFNENQEQVVSLIENDSGHFENRWVWLNVEKNNSPWLSNIDKMYLPIRHGEGKFVVKDNKILKKLINNNQIALKYYNPNSKNVEYPYNPNGSIENIAGIFNKKGNVLGLMPHPEAYIFKENHPRWIEGNINEDEMGLRIFINGINYFK